MSRCILLGVLLTSLFFVQSVLAAVIELKDGSQINGQVLSLSGGNYKIYSASVGMLKIPQSKVRAIHEDNAPLSGTSARTNSPTPKRQSRSTYPDINSVKKRILADKQLQQSIIGLQSDPSIQAILRDKEILKAIEAQDFQSLSRNPKIIELMNNARVGEITRQLK